jgi:hypothetical protein
MGRNPKNEEVTSVISRNINSGHENMTIGFDVVGIERNALATSEQQ